MALNAGVSLGKHTDQILRIIQRECGIATEWWRHECEGQQRYIDTLYNRSLQLQTEKTAALVEKRDEVDRYKSEVERYKTIAKLWRSKYEVAIKSRDDALLQLSQTQARFSLTIVPLSPTGSPVGTKLRAPVLDFRAEPSDLNVPPPSDDSTSLDDGEERHRTSISYPAPAATAAVGDGSLNLNEAHLSVALNTSLDQDLPREFQAKLHTGDPQLHNIAASETLLSQGMNVAPSDTTTSRSIAHPSVPSARFVEPSVTASNVKLWCYCTSPEFGKMIMCSNTDCPKQWFHVPCTGLKHVPKGDWLCEYCTIPPSKFPPV